MEVFWWILLVSNQILMGPAMIWPLSLFPAFPAIFSFLVPQKSQFQFCCAFVGIIYLENAHPQIYTWFCPSLYSSLCSAFNKTERPFLIILSVIALSSSISAYIYASFWVSLHSFCNKWSTKTNWFSSVQIDFLVTLHFWLLSRRSAPSLDTLGHGFFLHGPVPFSKVVSVRSVN